MTGLRLTRVTSVDCRLHLALKVCDCPVQQQCPRPGVQNLLAGSNYWAGVTVPDSVFFSLTTDRPCAGACLPPPLHLECVRARKNRERLRLTQIGFSLSSSQSWRYSYRESSAMKSVAVPIPANDCSGLTTVVGASRVHPTIRPVLVRARTRSNYYQVP